jgi:hypothetical protein
MIINQSDYNPLEALEYILPDEAETLTLGLIDEIKKELFKGGVVPESDDELEQLLEKLHEVGIITLKKVGYEYTIAKGPEYK